MKKAFIFPGQGSQFVGMGQDLAQHSPVAKAVFEEVDEALGESLSRIIWQGPEDMLRSTKNTQPALMALSLAIVRTLEAEGVSLAGCGSFVAGHSLGEYSALAAAGALSIRDAACLLRLRGQAMQEAVSAGEGAMAALIGVGLKEAELIASKASDVGVCEAANDNAPGQIVLSGHKKAIEKALDIAKEYGAKRSVLLPVSAPFHCQLMAPAAQAIRAALATTSIKTPALRVVCNVSAEATLDVERIRMQLIEQVTGRVRWRESIGFMASQGVSTFYELGAGKVLTGLLRRIEKTLNGKAISTPQDIEALVGELR